MQLNILHILYIYLGIVLTKHYIGFSEITKAFVGEENEERFLSTAGSS